MVKIRKALPLLVCVLLLPIAFAEISKFETKPIANGVIRISFTISGEPLAKSYTLFRDSLVLRQRSIQGDPFSDLHDDLETENKREYTYTLKIYGADNSVVGERTLRATADSEAPQVISERKILSKLNTVTVWTNEDAICKAGVSSTNLLLMDGREKVHSLRMGLVNGLNMIYILCEDSFGNAMRSQKMIEYTYDVIPPGQIKKIDAINSMPGSVAISWLAARDANGIKEYRIYKRIDGEEKSTFIGRTNATSYADRSGLREGKTYIYSVSPVDNADNEGIRSPEENVTLYNSDIFLDVARSYSTKTGDVEINGKAYRNSQISARLGSAIYETRADDNGDFAIAAKTERSGIMQIEAFDENGNSKVASVAIVRLAPDIEAEKTVLVREEKANLIYIFLIAFLFLAVIFIVIYSTKKKSLYGDIDSYLKRRNKKE